MKKTTIIAGALIVTSSLIGMQKELIPAAAQQKSALYLEATDERSKTIFFDAVSCNNIPVVRHLTTLGKSRVHDELPDGRTALHIAVELGYVNMVALLIRRGACPDVNALDGKSPKALASANQQHEMVMLFNRMSQKKVESTAEKYFQHKRTRERVEEEEHVQAPSIAVVNSLPADEPTASEENPLRKVQRHIDERAAPPRELHPLVPDINLQSFIDPIKTIKAQLEVALKAEDLEALKNILARAGNLLTPADINMPAFEGWTLLNSIILMSDSTNELLALELIDHLIARGADVNAPNTSLGKITPLFLAVKVRKPRLVANLLEKGADPLLPSQNGWTPCFYTHTQTYKQADTCFEAYQKSEIIRKLLDNAMMAQPK